MNENVVIIPTFNEKENITITISEISKLKTKFDIIVVDDNSPDKTGEIVKMTKFDLTGDIGTMLLKGTVKMAIDLSSD